MTGSVRFCPKCQRPVEAKDYFANKLVVAGLESVLPFFNCPCGYYGPPVQLSAEEYLKMRKEDGKAKEEKKGDEKERSEKD